MHYAPHAPAFQSFLPVPSTSTVLPQVSQPQSFLNLSKQCGAPLVCPSLLICLLSPPEWELCKGRPRSPHCMPFSGGGSTLPYICSGSWRTPVLISLVRSFEKTFKNSKPVSKWTETCPSSSWIVDKVINMVKGTGIWTSLLFLRFGDII